MAVKGRVRRVSLATLDFEIKPADNIGSPLAVNLCLKFDLPCRCHFIVLCVHTRLIFIVTRMPVFIFTFRETRNKVFKTMEIRFEPIT